MIVGEAPGEREEAVGRPFVGPSGFELDRLLADAGLLRAECLLTNVARERPAGNDITLWWKKRAKAPDPTFTLLAGYWCAPQVSEGLALLQKEIEACKPTVIIAFGNLALWALTGHSGIGNWRGSTLRSASGCVVVPTFHPAAVLRQWSWRSYVVHDLKRAAGIVRGEGEVEAPNYRFIVGPSYPLAADALAELLSQAAKKPLHLAVDIETRLGHIDCIGLAWSRTEAICIPFFTYKHPEGYYGESEETSLIRLLRDLLGHPNVYVSGQNWSYDAQYILRHHGILVPPAWDTMLAHHTCWPGTDKGLHVLSSLYCKHHVFWKEENKEANTKQDDVQRWNYNCLDCVRTFEIAEEEGSVVEQLGLSVPVAFQHRVWGLALKAMRRGVRIDRERRTRMSRELADALKERVARLNYIAGHELSPNSPKQMMEFFYNDLKIRPVLIRRADGRYTPSCNDEALEKIARREPVAAPIVSLISEMRSIRVFRSTFIEAELDRDGRMRSSYNVGGTTTFRFSSSQNPFGSGLNLQNIPSGEELESGFSLPNVRELFVPDEGKEMFDMDLDSADLQVVAWESNCPRLKDMLRRGEKVYVELMRRYYRDPTITKKHPRYTEFKSLCHGSNYLGSAEGMAGRLGLGVAQCRAVQDWYFSVFPEIKDWQERFKLEFSKTHEVRNAWGYRRFFFDRVEGTVYNEAIAWKPQSTIALLINKIWEQIDERGEGAEVLMQVHDSLVGQYPADQAPYYRELLGSLSRIQIPYADPLVIGTGLKTSQESWGKCA